MNSIINEMILNTNMKSLDLDDKKKINEILNLALTEEKILRSYIESFKDFCIFLSELEQIDNIIIFKAKELKFRILRLSLGEGEKEIIDNTQFTTPANNIECVRIIDVKKYSDGSYEEEEIYNLHPKYENIDDEGYLFNDYAQMMINEL